MSKITLYNGIKADLLTVNYLKSNGTYEYVKTVALWRNQIEKENVEIPFLYPAVFIEFLSSNYMESSSKTYQELTLTVRLHICYESYLTEDLDLLNLTQEVYSKMQLKQYGFFGVMKRRNEEQDFDHNNVQDFKQDYEVSQAKDYGADKRPSTLATINDIVIIPDIELTL
jgi:hypothetical protein